MIKKTTIKISVLTLALMLLTSCLKLVPRDIDADTVGADSWTIGTDAVIEAGGFTGYVILPDNTLWGWGINEFGQLGDGTLADHHSPIFILDDVIAVSGGIFHTMAIRSDGSLWGWGGGHGDRSPAQNFGQVGDGERTLRVNPVWIMDDVVAVSAGGLHTMAIRGDGSLWGWGLNASGQIGNGTLENQFSPVLIMDDVAAVSADGFHTMAIRTDGSLWGWGLNVAGRIGDGTTENRLYPVRVLDNITHVSVGFDHTMAIRADGSLWGWGGDYRDDIEENLGQIGDGERIPRHYPVWVMDDVSYVSAGAGHTMAIRTDGSLWAWGSHNAGQVGDGSAMGEGIDPSRPIPSRIMNNVIAVSSGDFHNIAITVDGSLWSWGWNVQGQLGDGTTQDRNAPTGVVEPVQ